ncbi:AAA-domain-containing protein [Ascodesmis nigricans]|uniref:Peroxisomal ATPase PEX1 n=1 Tax=Ascodesmis nigricans TaxID=341454 RepID=A0A4S2N4X6_9PEZI|nr:AAA-domain-containing protein [Ascodesmis nigricans]
MKAAQDEGSPRGRESTPPPRENQTPLDTVTLAPPAPSTGVTADPVPPLSPAKVVKRRPKERGDEPRVKRVKSSSGTATAAESREPPKNVTLADLGGIDEVVDALLEFVVLPLSKPEIYESLGVPFPRGVLLHGPPGCGKTYLANALAGELGMPFLSVSAPSIVSGMSGESEKKVRELFEEAREKAPCLVFLDEIDAITPKRESAQREMERRIVAQLLTCMDDLAPAKNDGKPVMVIGATNRPDSLDPALRRAGRFEKEICLTVPDEEAREKILKVMCGKLRLEGDFDFKRLAKNTPGFVGADLGALTAEAGRVAIHRIFESLKPEHMEPPTPHTDPPTNEPTEPSSSATPAPTTIALPKSSLIQNFLTAFPTRLTPSQLSTLHITMPDFLAAIPKIQPSSKREGFSTVPDVTWSSIGALHSIREDLRMSIVLPITDPGLFTRAGLSKPIGVLLWGPPGCGKTLLAKAVANESNANFISVKGPELLNKYVGESERAVRQVFSRARASKPCIIFFDELDALVPRRDDSLSEASARVVNTLLTELDGLEDRNGVFVIAATNRPDVIDPAMLRPGRLDKPILVDLPTFEEKVEIFRTLTRKTPMAPDVDLEEVLRDKRTERYSGADLSALVREATTEALRTALKARTDRMMQRITEVGEDGNLKMDAGAEGELTVVVGMDDFRKGVGRVKESVNEKQRMVYTRLATTFAVKG